MTKACTYIKGKLQHDPTLPLRTNLTVDDIILLLEFTLSNNYFIYNGDTYRQLHGCAMGTPVSPVVANLCMEEIEEEAINIAEVKPKVWKRYVDDGFCIINSNAVASFHDNLNSIDPDINFTVEHEKDNQLPFLDTLVTRQNNQIKIDVYRKPTHTDRYQDFKSHHPKTHKQYTINTLIHRTTTLPTTEGGVTNELNYVTDALTSNGYPKRLIQDAIKMSENPIMVTPEPDSQKTSPGHYAHTTFELPTSLSQHCNNYFLPRNSDQLLKSKRMLFTEYPVRTATGAILGKPGDRS